MSNTVETIVGVYKAGREYMSYFCDKHIYDLKYCNEKTVDALKKFCTNINRTHADIYIIMAQKAICLFSILQGQNLIAPHVLSATIISNEALDFSSLNFKGQHVVLIDDIIVSGSTLAVTAEKLIHSCGASLTNLQIISLALDTDYQTMRFTDANDCSIISCGKAVPNVECIELSHDICQIFAQYGYPYDTDFPDYPELDLSVHELQRQTNGILWESFCISTMFQKKAAIDTVVLFPSKVIERALWARLGTNLDKKVHFKLRMYMRSLPGERVMCKFTPMALFHETSFSNISNLFMSISAGIPSEIVQHWSMRTKLLFIQYYFAHLLMLEFASHLDCPYVPEVLDTPLSVHFGPILAPVVKDILQRSNEAKDICASFQWEPHPDNLIFDTLGCITFPKKLDGTSQLDDHRFDLNDALLTPFIDQHVRWEKPARKMMHDGQFHFRDDIKEISHLATRVNRGYSLRALENILGCVEENYNREHLVSLFIDRAVDSGIIVPIVYIDSNQNTICRAYRHGEDLPFGEADRCRLLYFLYYLDYSLKKNGYKNGVAPRSFEKMIVLFYQIGLRGITGQRSIFNRFLGFNNMLLLHERFSVHGAVMTPYRPTIAGTDPQPHFYYEITNSTDLDDANDGYSQWLTNWLIKNKFVKPLKIDSILHYTVDSNNIRQWCTRFMVDPQSEKMDLSNLSHDIKNDIEVIVNLLVTWYSKSPSKDVFKDDITILTSCYDQSTFASALMTEVHYFKKYYDNQIEPNIEHYCSESYYEETDNLFCWPEIATALYSGQQKYDWYIKEQSQKVINETSKLFDDSGRYIWNTIWSRRRVDSPIAPNNLQKYIIEGMGYLYFYTACYEWLNNDGLIGRCDKLTQDHIRQCKKMYLTFVEADHALYNNGNRLLDDKLFCLFDQLISVPTPSQRANMFQSKVWHVLQASEALLLRVEDELAHNSDIYSVYYASCLVLEFDELDRSQTESLLMALWDLQQEDWDKTRLNIVRFECEDVGVQRYGIFYQNSKDSFWDIDSFPIYRVYRQLCNMLRRYACGFRIALIPELPAGRYFCHNTLSNLKWNTKLFSESVLDSIAHLWTRDQRQLLILLRPENSVEWFSSLSNGFDKRSQSDQCLCSFPNTSSELAVYHYFIPQQPVSREIAIVDQKGVVGTGVLYSQDGIVYALTCQHVLKDCITVSGRFSPSRKEFPLRRLNLSNSSPVEQTHAEQELAILLPKWEGYCPISLQDVFSKQNCISKIQQGSVCRCFGYPDERGRWEEQLEYSGPVGEGYDQLHFIGKKLGAGFSGSPVILKNDSNIQLIGLHVEHQYIDKSGIAFIIPSKTITAKMNGINVDMWKGELFEDEQQNRD